MDELWLAIYNYQGAPVRFWDFASLKGAFWRGNVRAGFVIEVTERREHGSAAAFLAHLRRAQIADSVDEERIRTVTYSSGDESITLEYDLWRTQPVARRLNGTVCAPSNLASPLAVQGDSDRLQAGEARLFTNPQQIWLIAQELDPALHTYVAVNPTQRITALCWETSAGVVSALSWGMGRIAWTVSAGGEQSIAVEGLAPPVDLTVPPGAKVVGI